MRHLAELGSTVGSGSYAPDDVQFLLQPLAINVTDVAEKERLIQSGRRHYSEMISQELPPTEAHLELYRRALAENGQRLGTEVQALAQALDRACDGPSIVLVSFVRAGLPLGVLLRRALVALGRTVHHYGISIIRDRGIDRQALDLVIQAHGAENILFVDGWTGKGAIAGELCRSLAHDPHFPLGPKLVVLADPCGRAWLAASAEDWLIPSGILGATVSGLISRSIWPAKGGLHGCIVYTHLEASDLSRDFVNHVDALRCAASSVAELKPWSLGQCQQLQQQAERVVMGLAERFSIDNRNRIKPGIAEATRAVLRRVPDQVLVRCRNDRDVQLLTYLTERAGIQVTEAGAALGPYRAVTIIRRVG